jgi:hypothetical protein
MISLRELKEARLRMRMLRSSGLLTAEHDSVIVESDELVRILATVIRKIRRCYIGVGGLNVEPSLVIGSSVGSWALAVVGRWQLVVGN